MDEPKKHKRKPFDILDGLMDDDLFGLDDDFHMRIHERIDRLMREAFANVEDMKVEPGRSFVYGFSMQTGPDGKPVVKEFGNVPKSGAAHMPGEREPLVDVIDGESEVTVIAELPGVEKEDIDLNADERSLSIIVDAKERRYHKELRLPADVDPDSIKAAYKNGILEVKLKRIERKRNVKRKVQVD